MPTPTSRTAYMVYYDVLDRALDSPAGIRVEVETLGDAQQYRVKLHSARSLDRELNREGRNPGDPNYGVSDYDNLIVRVRPEGESWWVYIEPSVIPNRIEELEPNGTTYPHRPDETPQEVHMHNLRRGVQPKSGAVDHPSILPIKHGHNRSS